MNISELLKDKSVSIEEIHCTRPYVKQVHGGFFRGMVTKKVEEPKPVISNEQQDAVATVAVVASVPAEKEVVTQQPKPQVQSQQVQTTQQPKQQNVQNNNKPQQHKSLCLYRR